MTARKPVTEMQRPGRRVSELLRQLLHCPMCGHSELETVHFRRLSCRLRCRQCAVAFSVIPAQVARRLSALDLGDSAEEIAQALYHSALIAARAKGRDPRFEK
jgi:transcription elongation factor Elf1